MANSLTNNTRTKYNLKQLNNIKRDNICLNTISYCYPIKKSKTHFEENKHKEEIETINVTNNHQYIRFESPCR